jgi:hypothetical protein
LQAKEMSNTQFEIIFTHNLSDQVRHVSEWSKLPVGACEALFLQMQTHLLTSLKRVTKPNVGYVVSYTWHWISPRYHETIDGDFGSV